MKYLLLPSICPEVQASHKKYSRDHVSESDRQYIVQHHIFNGHLRTIEHTVRNQEHVCVHVPQRVRLRHCVRVHACFDAVVGLAFT